jgi:hypothetical protein
MFYIYGTVVMIVVTVVYMLLGSAHRHRLYVYLCDLEYASQAYFIAGCLREYEQIV